MDEAQQATIRKTEADTDAVYIQAGVLDPSEVRQRLASDTNSPYDGLDPDDMPETPDMGMGGEALKDEETGANTFAADSGEWDESQHPRAENGQFGSAGIGNKKIAKNGPFGEVLTQYRHNAKAAIRALMERKDGEAVGALYHPDVGDIDLIYGSEGTPEKGFIDGYGLAKIAKKHPEVLENLQDILDDMQVRKRSANRVILESESHKAAVSLNWLEREKKWLLSAYEKNKAG